MNIAKLKVSPAIQLAIYGSSKEPRSSPVEDLSFCSLFLRLLLGQIKNTGRSLITGTVLSMRVLLMAAGLV